VTFEGENEKYMLYKSHLFFTLLNFYHINDNSKFYDFEVHLAWTLLIEIYQLNFIKDM